LKRHSTVYLFVYVGAPEPPHGADPAERGVRTRLNFFANSKPWNIEGQDAPAAAESRRCHCGATGVGAT